MLGFGVFFSRLIFAFVCGVLEQRGVRIYICGGCEWRRGYSERWYSGGRSYYAPFGVIMGVHGGIIIVGSKRTAFIV